MLLIIFTLILITKFWIKISGITNSILQNWLKISNSKVEKIPCVISDKNLQQYSDHCALTVDFSLN